ncbi:MAG: hypothetical protein HFE30_09695, partial [Clostridiales bacterium]|nr:hypothetical protein [Clostridiales bacterium]
PDENATRAEVATMLTRFDMDPMYYVVSNLGEYLATRDTRPLLQFSDSQDFSIETMNNIILPQVGLDPDKYTVVLPEYQMHKMTDDEENDYKKPIIGEDGKQKVDEKGELLFSNEDCGCGSFYGDCGFSGAGGGTDPKQNQMVLEPWFAIKNTNGTEDTSDDVVTQYVRYEWTVIKMDSSAENDQVYVGLKNLNDTVTAYARKLDKNSILNLVIQAAAVESDGVNEALSTNGKTTPAGYAYSVKVSDEQIEAALNAFNALKNNGEKTGELTLDVTVQNKATFKPAVTCSISMIIEMDKGSLIPWVG